MAYLSNKEINTLRGKASVGMATVAEVLSVFEHLDTMEIELDLSDEEDKFGSQGWRYYFGVPEE